MANALVVGAAGALAGLPRPWRLGEQERAGTEDRSSFMGMPPPWVCGAPNEGGCRLCGTRRENMARGWLWWKAWEECRGEVEGRRP